MNSRIIPTLLIEDGRLIKTVKYRPKHYLGDPVNAVRIFNEKGVDELAVIDRSASTSGNTNPALIEHICSEAFMPVTYGGGLGSVQQVREIIRCGVEKVVIGAAIADDRKLLTAIAAELGSSSVVAAVDVRRKRGEHRCFVEQGRRDIGTSAVELAVSAQESGAGEILLTSVDREGTWHSYDLELISLVASAVTIPVVANGGARDREDLFRAIHVGAAAAAAGSLFSFQGHGRGVLINYPDKTERT